MKKTIKPPVNLLKLRAELARRGMTQSDLASQLHERPTTFSAWLRGVNPAPSDLAERIAGQLGLSEGDIIS